MLIGPPDEPAAAPAPPSSAAGEDARGWTPADVADVVIGLAVVAVEGARRVADRAGFAVPVAAVAWVPMTLGRRLRAQPWVGDVLARGEVERREAAKRAYALGQRVAPGLLDSVLGLVDVNDLVHDHVDLDALAADLDVDAIVARADLQKAIDRVDIDGVVAGVDLQRIIDRIDVDAIVARANIQAVIDRVDVDAVVARADLQKAIDRVDIDGIVAGSTWRRSIDRVDIDGIVAGVDLQRIIDRVDVDAVVARADFDAVIAKLDLIELAEFVVEGIDLPGIIRSSTGSMASEGLREVRRQGIGADERVAHVVDRLLRRPERAPGQPAAPTPCPPPARRHGPGATASTTEEAAVQQPEDAPRAGPRASRSRCGPIGAGSPGGHRDAVPRRVDRCGRRRDGRRPGVCRRGRRLLRAESACLQLPRPGIRAALRLLPRVPRLLPQLAWATTGRSYGGRLLGLRVVDSHGRRIRPLVALARALLCVFVPVVLFWVIISRENRSAADILLRTSVVYDWASASEPDDLPARNGGAPPGNGGSPASEPPAGEPPAGESPASESSASESPAGESPAGGPPAA